jgi:hypothetical protein
VRSTSLQNVVENLALAGNVRATIAVIRSSAALVVRRSSHLRLRSSATLGHKVLSVQVRGRLSLVKGNLIHFLSSRVLVQNRLLSLGG